MHGTRDNVIRVQIHLRNCLQSARKTTYRHNNTLQHSFVNNVILYNSMVSQLSHTRNTHNIMLLGLRCVWFIFGGKAKERHSHVLATSTKLPIYLHYLHG